MLQEELNLKLINSFCKEYQSVWLIKSSDQSMSVYSSHNDIAIPGSIDSALKFNCYEKSRIWYIEHFVLERYKKRMLQQTTMENILKMTENGNPYFIGYARFNEDKINYNQLCYDRIEDDNGNVKYILLGFRDIDERRNADVDNLTGLLTRQAFCTRAEGLLKRNPDKQFDIVISDVIDFKEINEVYGIDVADDILRWIGAFFSLYIDETLIVGRYGSDQMVIMGLHETVLKYISENGMSNYIKAEKSNGLPSIVLKFGVYENIQHDKTIISSCDKAHIALNNIKGHYKDIFAYYDQNLEDQLKIKRKIESSMYESLKNDDFKVYYQPKHDAVSGKLVGAEALIRWIHPDYGFMSPAEFIPQFEKNGFIVEIDNFVWKKTCENLRKWQDKGIKTVPVSVNASKLTFSQENLLKKLQMPVIENQISPKKLHIEITETLMTGSVEDLIIKLTALRAIGYEIELDDFGAGYSSINLLSTLPIDTIKLDMSFIKQFDNEKRIKVLAACINLARELGYNTISEGVEREEQSAILELLGVDMIQGYLFSKPLPEDEFEQYIIDNT